MDNLAHTLIGAALGRVVAGRELPAAGWIGAVAGNAPDVAELLLRPNSWSPDAGVTYLVFHRGITHSLVGAALEIAVLAGVIGLIAREERAVPRRPLPRGAGSPRVSPSLLRVTSTSTGRAPTACARSFRGANAGTTGTGWRSSIRSFGSCRS